MTDPNLPALCSLEDFLKHEYDFIIVGGGTAGLVVAARLTENPNISVGVLEAGPAHINDPLIMTPALYSMTIMNPEYDWGHKTVVQRGLKNKKPLDQSRGKGLGGSSGINYQMYNRGHISDYDAWAALGNPGWDFKSLLPYFKKHENFSDPSLYASKNNIPLETTYDPSFHGTAGPIHTSFSTWRLPQEKEWIEASAKLGKRFGSPKDGWSGDHIGTFHSLSSIDRSGGPGEGTRSYSVTGYLLPNAQRPNLHVLTEALVTKLVLEKGKPAVTGLEFEHGGKKHVVNVKKEVVLSAGVYKTPQILELSGIGNPDVLKKAGVECLVANPRVGENLQDHPATGIGLELIDGQKSLDMLQDPATLEAAQKEYMATRTGPLSSGGSATGFIALADICSKDEISSIQKRILDSIKGQGQEGLLPSAKKLIAEDYASHDDGSIQIVLLPAALNLSDVSSQKSFFAGDLNVKARGGQGFALASCLARPVSAGSVHISSSDPNQDPDIDPAYLLEDVDAEILARGLQIAMKMAETSPLKELLKGRYWPGPEVDIGTLEGLVEYVKGHTTTEYHPMSSCSMGKQGEGAVDGRLRVWGVKGVRVVDASAIPLQVSGNIQSAVYALAEKGCDLIKEDWGI
jgi:choline dehydrogenase-like flavoprotein